MPAKPTICWHGALKVDRACDPQLSEVRTLHRLGHDISSKPAGVDIGHSKAYSVHRDAVTHRRTF